MMTKWKREMDEYIIGLAITIESRDVFLLMTDEERISYFCEKLKKELSEASTMGEPH